MIAQCRSGNRRRSKCGGRGFPHHLAWDIGGDGAVVIGNRAGVVGRMTNEERILALIRSSERALTDREIREQTGIEPRAQVNQICNRLAEKGLTLRENGPHGSLVNGLVVEDEGDPAYPASGPAKEREVGTLGPRGVACVAGAARGWGLGQGPAHHWGIIG